MRHWPEKSPAVAFICLVLSFCCIATGWLWRRIEHHRNHHPGAWPSVYAIHAVPRANRISDSDSYTNSNADTRQ